MLHTQITCLKSFRIGAFFATGLLSAFLALFIFPTASMDDTKAANTLSETTLSMTTSDITLDFTPTDLNGSFASSTPAEFSVTTNNYSGYSLSIAAAENNANNSKLINGNYYLNSISQASIETDFTNGTWGYKPSLINSQANTNYLPAPSFAGDVLETTNQANDVANTYSIELGVKANYTTPSGSYANTFVVSAIANAVGYQITYDKNTEDEVTNMPESLTGDVSATDIFVPNTTPQRQNYIFIKWHDEDKDMDFNPGDPINLTQLANTNYFHLKAIWRKVAYLDTGENVNIKLKKLAGNTGNVSYGTTNTTIKEIMMADFLPNNFIPSTDNTISLTNSPNPIYAWYDNTDGKGVIYLYANEADVIANWDSGYMFSYMQSLANIDGITNWDTSNVTNMQNMFYNASSLTNIDGATNWNTSNVTSMGYMFYKTKIANIDALATGTRPGNSYVSWDTSNVTNMSGMFSNATSLININGATNWDTSNVTTMDEMFYRATSLTNIDGATNWDTSNVTNMNTMFSNATSLTNISGATNWNTSNVTSMYNMFGYTSVTNVDALATTQHPGDDYVSWDTSNVTNMQNMFYNASSLTNIDGATNWDTSNVTTMSQMFYNASSLTNIDGASNWNTSKVTAMEGMFALTKITNIDTLATGTRPGNDYVSWDTSSVTNMRSMFNNASSLTNIDGASNWNTSSVINMSYMFYSTKITNIDALATGTRPGNDYVSWDTSNVTTMSQMFHNASSLTNIDGATNWNTSKVTTMEGMFGGTSITNLNALATGTRPGNDYVSWDTSKVTRMNSMFLRAFYLENIDGVANWNTSNVTNMASMFENTRIAGIDALATGTRPGNDYVSWDTSKVANMSGMFSSARSLTNIDGASNWDTSNVTNMSKMFVGTKITNIDALATIQHQGNDYVSWDTSKVTTMEGMFQGAALLTDIDGASNWDTSKVVGMYEMFRGTGIANIDGAANWNTSSVTNMQNMFFDASSLANIDGALNWNTSKVTTMEGMFARTNITNINALATGTRTGNNYVSWDTSSVVRMNGMFDLATSLANIDGAANWNTSKVTIMDAMFHGASSLTNIDGASSWNTSNVTSMQAMFSSTKITNIDALATGTRPGNDYVSWDTSKVTNMYQMFSGVTSLINVNGAINWDTSKVTNMSQLFFGDSSLADISGLAGWNTSIVKQMANMFQNARSISSLHPLDGWDVSSVTDMTNIFYGIPDTVLRPTWY